MKAELPVIVEEGVIKVTTVVENFQQLECEADGVQVCMILTFVNMYVFVYLVML